MAQRPHAVQYEYVVPHERYYYEEPVYYPKEYGDFQGHINCVRPEVFYGENAAVVPVRVRSYNGESAFVVPKQQASPYGRSNAVPNCYDDSRGYYNDIRNYNTKACQSGTDNPETVGKEKDVDVNSVGSSRIPRPIASKKFPVTFPITKHYKKPHGVLASRRPSGSLCGPVTTQRIFAGIRRYKKNLAESDDCSEPRCTVFDSEKCEPLEGFQASRRHDDAEKIAAQENKDEIPKLARLLKTDVSSTIRDKSESKKRARKSGEPAKNPPSAALDKLLDQLKKRELIPEEAPGERKDEAETDEKTPNVHEFKSSTDGAFAKSLSNCSSLQRKHIPRSMLDDTGALELHKSKSYIINLIDRALSKELGTVPSSRTADAEQELMDARRAIGVVNRHVSGRNSLCSKAESRCSAQDTMELAEDEAVSAKCKVCKCTSEEPAYIKQLKQLRWGHLRHIQREIRRLEELERFLDTCSTIPE